MVPDKTNAATQPAVRLEDVSKTFDGKEVVRGLSLEIGAGEFFALLGPSGCGKTTTLKLIGGFEQPDRGHVEIGGTRVEGVPSFRRDVNTVFQSYALFPHMDVRDNVAFGLRMSGVKRAERRARAEEALERVHLPGAGRRQIEGLSGGEQQRVALARAIINRPSVLLLDEPLGALDLKLRRAMQQELKEIQRSVGICFIYVTHDQHEALAMADRMAVMKDGLIQQMGTPQDVYDHPRSRYVAQFIGDAGFLDGRLLAVENGRSVIELPGGLQVRAPEAGLVKGPVVVALRPEKASLPRGGDRPDPSRNEVEGVIASVEYLGSDRIYRVAVPPAGELVVRETSTEDDPVLEPGTRATVAFDIDSAVALPGVDLK